LHFKEPDYYIHGTDDDDSFGEAESHGCIRMHEEDVTELARLVMEHGGKPMPEPLVSTDLSPQDDQGGPPRRARTDHHQWGQTPLRYFG
jgi:hypothetical protein